MERFGIIGAGFGLHIILPAIRSIDQAEVIGIADSGSGRLKDQISAQCDYFSNWKDLVAHSKINTIWVAAPPLHHYEMTKAALNAGKNIICEKPFGTKIEQAQELRRICEDKGLRGAINYTYRFERGFTQMREACRTGMLGEVQYIESSWFTGGRSDPAKPYSWQNNLDSGGGVLESHACHVLDYLSWITDQSISDIQTSLCQTLIPQRVDPSSQTQKDCTAEDLAILAGSLDKNVSFKISVSNTLRAASGQTLEIYGTRGRLRFAHRPPYRDQDLSLNFYPLNGAPTSWTAKLPIHPVPGLAGPVAQLVQEWVHGPDLGQSPRLASLSDGIKVRQALHALRQH